MGQSIIAATSAGPLAQRQDAGREASDGKSWQENTGSRRQNMDCPGGHMSGDAVDAASRLSHAAASAYLYPKEQRQDASAGNSLHTL